MNVLINLFDNAKSGEEHIKISRETNEELGLINTMVELCMIRNSIDITDEF